MAEDNQREPGETPDNEPGETPENEHDEREPNDEPDEPSDDLDGLRRAIARERELRRDAERTAREATREAKRADDLARALAETEADRDDAKRTALVWRVAHAKGVPTDLVDRLRGDTEDELAADADVFLAQLTPAERATRSVPKASRSQGATSPNGPTDVAERFADALRTSLGR